MTKLQVLSDIFYQKIAFTIFYVLLPILYRNPRAYKVNKSFEKNSRTVEKPFLTFFVVGFCLYTTSPVVIWHCHYRKAFWPQLFVTAFEAFQNKQHSSCCAAARRCWLSQQCTHFLLRLFWTSFVFSWPLFTIFYSRVNKSDTGMREKSDMTTDGVTVTR